MVQFTPNIWQRYAASLRSIIQDRIIQRGLTEQDRTALRRILLFEAVTREEYPRKVNMPFFLSDLIFKAQYVFACHAKRLSFRLYGSGVYAVDSDLFQLLILLLIRPSYTAVSLTVHLLDDGIVLIVSGGSLGRVAEQIVRAQKGHILYEQEQNRIAVRLSIPQETFHPQALRKSKGDLNDPLSLFHLLLFR